MDKNGVWMAVSFGLERGENPLRLEISHPAYYLTDPYSLKLDK
jgi:hypothetical protein